LPAGTGIGRPRRTEDPNPLWRALLALPRQRGARQDVARKPGDRLLFYTDVLLVLGQPVAL